MKQFAPVLRWSPIVLGLGFGLVLTLVLQSLPISGFVSRGTQAERLRRDLASTALTVAEKLQNEPNASLVELDVLLADAKKASPRRLAWIQLRESNDSVLAQAGIEEKPTFTLRSVKARLASRKAAVKIVERAEGRLLVEAFPIGLGGRAGSVRVQRALNGPVNTAGPNAVLEIAAYLDGVSTR